MPAVRERVDNTRAENTIRSRLALATKYGSSPEELARLRLQYKRAVALRKAAEWNAEALRLQAELERIA